MSFKYSRYFSRVTRQPWAILPEKLAVLTDLARLRSSGRRLSDEDIAEQLGDERHPPYALEGADVTIQDNGLVMVAAAGASRIQSDGAIAVIPIHGTIAYRADSFEASSGGTSTELIGRRLASAIADDGIKAVLLDLDSPGGSVEGVPELASQLAKATAVKPVVAHVNALAASAGYWLASQATEILCTVSGMAGSIGVYALFIDESEGLAQDGIKVNAISAGDNKLEGAPWIPMSEDTRAFLQGQVDAVYRDFLAAVAKGRGVTVADVKKHYGQGRVFDAKTALGFGMIDGIRTFDDTLSRMLSSKAGTVGARAEGAADRLLAGFMSADDVRERESAPTDPAPAPAPGDDYSADDETLALMAALGR